MASNNWESLLALIDGRIETALGGVQNFRWHSTETHCVPVAEQLRVLTQAGTDTRAKASRRPSQA